MKFLTPFNIQILYGSYMKVLSPFRVEDDDGTIYLTPAGFISDGVSVRRVPIVYWLFGGENEASSALHDMLYRWALVPRRLADQLFLRALAHEDTLLLVGHFRWLAPLYYFRRHAMYWGVRLFGRKYYGRRSGGCLDPRVVCQFQCQTCQHYLPGWRKLNERTS